MKEKQAAAVCPAGKFMYKGECTTERAVREETARQLALDLTPRLGLGEGGTAELKEKLVVNALQHAFLRGSEVGATQLHYAVQTGLKKI